MSYTAPVERVGPGTPAGTLLRRYWHPVAVSVELAAGSARPLRLLGEDFTLYRDEGGVARLVGARCAHRGTLLHTGWIEGDCIRCCYHGWKFDPSGRCVEQPAEQDGFAEAARIPSYAVQEYAGLVFVHLSDDPPPLPHYAELDEAGVTAMGDIRPPGAWPANYFHLLENNVDPVHLSFVHRASQPFLNEVPEVSAERVDGGIAMTAIRGGVARRTRYWFPNLIQLPLTDVPGRPLEGRFFNWQVPVDDESTLFVASFAVPDALVGQVDQQRLAGRTMEPGAGAQLMAGTRRPASATEEDYIAMVGQGTFADRTSERLGRSDVGVIELRRLWQQALDEVAASVVAEEGRL